MTPNDVQNLYNIADKLRSEYRQALDEKAKLKAKRIPDDERIEANCNTLESIRRQHATIATVIQEQTGRTIPSLIKK